MKPNNFFFITLILIALSFEPNQIQAQGRINLAAGYGVPEWIFVAVKLPINQLQFEITTGASPIVDDNLFSIGGNFYYHFANSSKYSNLRPLYAKTGFYYMREDLEYNLHEYLLWSIRVGREFNISKNMGFAIDAGLFFFLKEWKTVKKPEPSSGFDMSLDYIVMPGFQGCFFYRF
ncbi:MAG: hypothetical protein WCX31_19915 [Salinivirgaceae bacterium]|jgi:hypothetical protein